MSDFQKAGLPQIEKFLDLVSYRQQLIAGNMANVDTPRFHTRDIDFRAEMQRALADTSEASQPAASEVSGLLERPDGNNVSLEREGMAMAETSLQFREGVQLLRREFRLLRMAINEGRGQ